MPIAPQVLQKFLEELQKEEIRAEATLHLTANENILSKTALAFCASPLGFRYQVGTYDDQEGLTTAPSYLIHNLMIRGLPSMFSLEQWARRSAIEMFHASYADFRPLAGMHAVFCILSTVTSPQDTVYVFSTDSVGHHATISLLRNLGRNVEIIPWDFSRSTIDLEQLKVQFKKRTPDVIFFDFGTPLFPLPLREIRALVGEEILMIYDGSHVLGLIAGGMFQSPLQEGCDILIGSTHKSFPGPQKGMILYKNEQLGREIAEQLFLSAISSQHTHHSLALYISLIEMSTYGKSYASQIVTNNQALSLALEAIGFSVFRSQGKLPISHMVGIVGGFSDTHHKACGALHRCSISTNSRNLFKTPSLRLGVQEVTRRGMKQEEMKVIAQFFYDILIGNKDKKEEVEEFNSNYPLVKYSFDEDLLCCQ